MYECARASVSVHTSQLHIMYCLCLLGTCRRRPATMHVVPRAVHARGRPVHGMPRLPVLRPSDTAVQAVSRRLSLVQRTRSVQLHVLHVPATPGQTQQPVRALLHTQDSAGLLRLRQGDW